jgi:mannose-6-phosphate isomerase-like protein (cupin superfamily)
MDVAPVEVLPVRMTSDDRGWSAFVFPEEIDLDLGSVHLIGTRPGQVRGNHLHPNRVEYLFFFGGQGLFFWEEDGNLRKLEVGGPGQMLRILPGVRHAYRNTGAVEAHILACWGPREKQGPDQVRAAVISSEGAGSG